MIVIEQSINCETGEVTFIEHEVSPPTQAQLNSVRADEINAELSQLEQVLPEYMEAITLQIGEQKYRDIASQKIALRNELQSL